MYPKSPAIFPVTEHVTTPAVGHQQLLTLPRSFLCELTYALDIFFPLFYVSAYMVSSCMHQEWHFVFGLSLDVSVVNLCVAV